MRKKTGLLLAILFVIFGGRLSAEVVGYSGGVSDELIYSEYVFVTGKPVLFEGTVSVSRSKRGNNETVSYRYDLRDTEDDKNRLTRNETYRLDYEPHQQLNQKTGNVVLTGYNEKIEFGENETYTIRNLKDIFFSQADVSDGSPAADFDKSAIKMRKMYQTQGGQVIVDVSGSKVGYRNIWGGTESMILNYGLSVKKGKSKNNIQEQQGGTSNDNNKKEETQSYGAWSGSYQVRVSASEAISLQYDANEANFSSFAGGHLKVKKSTQVSNYSYMLPSGAGSLQLNKSKMPELSPMIVSKYRDVNGHGSENAIKALYSLDVMDEYEDVFQPDLKMTRRDFVRALLKACNIKPQPADSKAKKAKKGEPLFQDNYFRDVRDGDKDFAIVEEGVRRGVIKGRRRSNFRPNEYIRKSEAVTFFIRALGFENRAPNPGYATVFTDDDEIPSWSKDAFYMAHYCGLIQPDQDGNIHPNDLLSRAESAEMLLRFLKFLEKDLQKDYMNLIRY